MIATGHIGCFPAYNAIVTLERGAHMPIDMPQAARELINKNKGKIDLDSISSIMESPEGKALLKQIASGGDSLKKAAAAAAEGDKGAVNRFLGSLLSTREGQLLAKQVMEISKKRK